MTLKQAKKIIKEHQNERCYCLTSQHYGFEFWLAKGFLQGWKAAEKFFNENN